MGRGSKIWIENWSLKQEPQIWPKVSISWQKKTRKVFKISLRIDLENLKVVLLEIYKSMRHNFSKMETIWVLKGQSKINSFFIFAKELYILKSWSRNENKTEKKSKEKLIKQSPDNLRYLAKKLRQNLQKLVIIKWYRIILSKYHKNQKLNSLNSKRTIKIQ